MKKTVFIFSASNTVAVAGYGLLWWNIFFKNIFPLYLMSLELSVTLLTIVIFFFAEIG